jgi:hypothetical protein
MSRKGIKHKKPINGEIVCLKCNTLKPFSAFYADGLRKLGIKTSGCKDCLRREAGRMSFVTGRKVCNVCNVEKDFAEYQEQKRGIGNRRACCKECEKKKRELKEYRSKKGCVRTKAWRLLRRERRRAQILKYLEGHPCVDCGASDPRILEFDHNPDKGAKSFNIGLEGRNMPFYLIEHEMTKCDVRCANCHRLKTSERNKLHWSHLEVFQVFLERHKKPKKEVKPDVQLVLF